MAIHTRSTLTLLSILLLVSTCTAALTLDLTSHFLNATQLRIMQANAAAHEDPMTSKLLRRQSTLSTAAVNRYNSYTATVSIGSPARAYNLLIDTGSSNTWIKNFTTSSTSVDTGNNWSVVYGLGTAAGRQYNDRVTLAGTAVNNQGVGRATNQTYFDYVDGLLGIGPTVLTRCTVLNTNCATVPTVVDNLKTQGKISSAVVGIQFAPVDQPYSSFGVQNGRMTLGGYDKAAIRGKINTVPFTTRSPARNYMGVDILGFKYLPANGATPVVLTNAGTAVKRAGIVDTGTTLLLLPDDVFKNYLKLLPGAFVNNAGFLAIPNEVVPSMGNLTFSIGAFDYALTPSAQLFTPNAAAAFGNSDSRYSYGIAASTGSIDRGDDFTLGMMWLERFYSIYDTDNKRMGFAFTADTFTRTHPLARPWTAPVMKIPKLPAKITPVKTTPKIVVKQPKKAPAKHRRTARHGARDVMRALPAIKV